MKKYKFWNSHAYLHLFLIQSNSEQFWKNWLYNSKKEDKNTYRKEDRKFNIRIPFPKKCVFYPIKRRNYCIDNTIDFLWRDLNQYNFYSYKMKSLFTFKMDDIFEIYISLLLEKPILFFSENKEKLTNIFFSFMGLLFLFEYQNPHCAILPDCNAGLVEEAKVSFLG